MTTLTSADAQYENLQELLDTEAGGGEKKHEVDARTGTVHRLNKDEVRVAQTHSNAGEFLDSIIRKNANKIASILDMSEDIGSRTAPPLTFTDVADFWTHFLTAGTTNAQDAINSYLSPDVAISVRPKAGNPMAYEYELPAGSWTTIGILELMEELYASHKIGISNLDTAAQKIARDKDRAEKKAEREANRPGGTTHAPGAPAGSPSSLQEVHEDLNVPQIQAALNFAKINKKTGSAYSFDKKWFPVRYENVAGVETYYACIQDERGRVIEINATNTSELIRNIMNTTKKEKERKDSADTVDMEKNFSRTKFLDLCIAISKSKEKRGEYSLNGKNYFVTEISPQIPPLPPSTTPTLATYRAEYPGHFEKETAGPLEANVLVTQLENNIHSHEHSDGNHVFSKKGFKDLCEHIIHAPNRRGEYELDGHKYPLWIEAGKLSNYIYHAEIPGEGGRTHEVTARSPERLYEKILKKGHRHSAEKPAESAAKAEGAEPKDAAKTEDHGAAHPKTEGTFYDRSVEKIFGHGLVGRAFIGTKNLIPKPLRSLGGNTVGAGVTSGIVGGALYGGSLALGSVALSSAIVPAMTLTFAASMTNRFLKWRKWWPHNKKEDGGGHGGH